MAECAVAQRAQAKEPERWVPVMWDSNTARHLSTRLDVTAINERGVLGRLAAEITDADSNILHISMPDESAPFRPDPVKAAPKAAICARSFCRLDICGPE